MSIVINLHVSATLAFSVPIGLWLPPLLGLSLATAVLAGVIPPRRAAGPDRIPPTRPALPLLGAMCGAMGVYLFTISLYATLKHPPAPTSASSNQLLEAPPSEQAFLSTMPPLMGLLALLAGGHFAHDASGQDFGLGLRRLRRGVAWGSVGVIIVVPPLFVLTDLLEFVYRRVHYRHPTEHPLLHTLGEKPGLLVTGLIVIGACVIAPLAEELFFRGYLQTLIRRVFSRLLPRHDQSLKLAQDSNQSDVSTGPVASVPSSPTTLQTWLAIVTTSMLFASVHPKWTWPIIFILAVCLGYAYERTGNLWVSIVIHAGFNTVQTAIFLIGLYSPH